MLPYFEQVSIHIGPVTIFVWGCFVMLGVVSALLVARSEARRARASFDHILDMSVWILIGAFLGARLAHIFFYEPHFFFVNPREIFMVWHGGLSSVGGISCGIAAALLYVRRKKIDLRLYGDIVACSIPAAWIIARFGCYLTHMHPGIRSNRFFAVAYPDGSRLDLGLLESCAWVVIGLIIWISPRSKIQGFYLALVPMLYAPARFALDFFRVRDGMMPDMRYLGLTPAQYGMCALFILAILFANRLKKQHKKI